MAAFVHDAFIAVAGGLRRGRRRRRQRDEELGAPGDDGVFTPALLDIADSLVHACTAAWQGSAFGLYAWSLVVNLDMHGRCMPCFLLGG